MSNRIGWLARKGESGQGMVELALVVFLLFLLVTGIIDFGFNFADHESIVNAARDGARYATTHPTAWSNAAHAASNTIEGQIQGDGGTAGITNDDSHIVISYLTSTGTYCGQYVAASSSFSAASGQSQSSCVTAGNLIQVTVSFAYHPITPIMSLFFPNGITITSTATMVEEQ